MVEIEERREAELRDPDYSGREFSAEDRSAKVHRGYVGGKWDQMGEMQLDFLSKQGLRADHRFIDVGCGSFRAGRHLIDHLDPGNYYGIDVNKPVMVAGYEDELTDAQRERLPVENLRATDRFDADFGVAFDMANAQSVFTHISLNHARLCMHRLSRVMAPGGRFFVTFLEGRPGIPVDKVLTGPRRFTERNPFWYYRADMRWLVRGMPWKFTYIGDWGHPVGQRMVQYTRMSDKEFAEQRSGAAHQPQQQSEPVPQVIGRAAGAARRLRDAARRLRG